MAKKLLDLLQQFENKEGFSETVPCRHSAVFKSGYYFPELYNDGKVKHSLITAQPQDETENFKYWYVSLAVRYSHHKIVEIRALEDLKEEDKGFHIQRFSFFKRYIDSDTICNHKNNRIKPSHDQSQIPCGQQLDLYTGSCHETLWQCMSLRKQTSTMSILTATILRENQDIPLLDSEEDEDKQRVVSQRDSISNEHGFSIDTHLLSVIFDCIFNRRQPFSCQISFIQRELDLGNSDSNILFYKNSIFDGLFNLASIFSRIMHEHIGLIGSYLSLIDINQLRTTCRQPQIKPQEIIQAYRKNKTSSDIRDRYAMSLAGLSKISKICLHLANENLGLIGSYLSCSDLEQLKTIGQPQGVNSTEINTQTIIQAYEKNKITHHTAHPVYPQGNYTWRKPDLA